MGMPANRMGRIVRSVVFGAASIAACSAQVLAQGQSTPIQSPQDAACRDEARARVFTTPDPKGLGLYAVGRQIYMGCMQRKESPIRRARMRSTAR